MPDNRYDEVPEPSSIDYSVYQMEKEELENKIEKLETKVEDLECDKQDLLEDIALIRTRNANFRKQIKDYKELVNVFLDNANNELLNDEEKLAKVFEYVHSKGWDYEYIRRKKSNN